jgi:predicted ATPase
MDNIEKKIKDLEQLVLNAPDETIRKIAQEQLDRVKERQKINVDKDFSGVITAINTLIEKVYNSSTAMSSQQIDLVIAERLKKLKINPSNLSAELKELIGQTKTTVIQINDIKVSSSTGDKGRRLEDVLLSDAEAQNNVYLFGESGTGKHL